MRLPKPSDSLGARLLWRGVPGYEEARRDAMWNARLPDRFPDAIALARDVYDVAAAVRFARREGMRVGVRSGGHSWAGNHVRDGGLLLDVSRMNDVALDAAARRAQVGPGCKGDALAERLGKRGLFFPTGHCRGVAVGGYLLQGGFGWNGRALGPACASVVGLDLVTADGALVHASEDENADLFWAARGAGPGFFAVVTRFHLRVYDKPRVTAFAFQSHPIGELENVFRFVHAIRREVPASVELQLVISANAKGVGGPGIEIFAPVFADGLRQALRDLSFLKPLRKKAALSVPFAPATLSFLYRAVMHHYPDRHRYAVDNLWTRAGIDALLPGLKAIARTMPPPPSHALWLNWSPPADRPAMAFSMEDETYLALYGGWRDAADDARYAGWAEARVREMAHLASGCQLADENLFKNPQRFVADANLQRLDRIRAERDREGRFHGWMGRPGARS